MGDGGGVGFLALACSFGKKEDTSQPESQQQHQIQRQEEADYIAHL